MKKIIIYTFVIIFIAIAGFYFFNQCYMNQLITDSNPRDAIDYVGEQTTIMHKDFKAIIKKDWQESEIPPSTYYYLPPGVSEEDANAEVISIMVQFLGENNQYSLEDLLKQGIENSKRIIPDFELIENIDGGKPNMPGKRIKFTGTQEGIKRSNIQVFGIRYDNLYSITYSCPVGNCSSHAIYNSLVESFEPIESKDIY